MECGTTIFKYLSAEVPIRNRKDAPDSGSFKFPWVPNRGRPFVWQITRHLLTKLGDPLKSALLKFKRQALHAYALGFFHPGREEHLDFHHQAPADFNNLLNLLS